MWYNLGCLSEQNARALCFSKAAVFSQSDIVGKAPSAFRTNVLAVRLDNGSKRGGRFAMRDDLPFGYLGKLCPRNHEYKNTKKSWRYKTHHCVLCNRERLKRHQVDNHEKYLEYTREYRNANREKIRDADHRYKEKNRDILRARALRRYHDNQERLDAHAREKRNSNIEIARQKEREYRKMLRHRNQESEKKYRGEYYRNNSVKIRLRSRLRKAFVMFSETGKTRRADEYGVDYEAIIKHIGPCPGNQSEWHIDHIKPLALFDFNDSDQIRKAFAPENHQWLPAKENIKKRDNYED